MKNLKTLNEFLNESRISSQILDNIRDEADNILDDLVGKPDYDVFLSPDRNPTRLDILFLTPYYTKNDMMNISDKLLDRLNLEFTPQLHLGNYTKSGFWLTW